MKFAFAFACLTLFAGPVLGQVTPPAGGGVATVRSSKGVRVIRSTSGRIVNESGLASTPYPVQKGSRFDLVSESFADVVVQRGATKVRLAKTDVEIYEKGPNTPVVQRPVILDTPAQQAAAAAATAAAEEAAMRAQFQPGGTLIVLSAKYTLEGNQPRNVKTKIEKLVPTGPLTQIVKIPVTDDLSSAAARQNRVVLGTSTGGATRVHIAPKNLLIVSYQYNGQTLTKQAVEGTTLYLP